MAASTIARALPLAGLLLGAVALGGCVSAGDSAGRASTLATTISRASACKAGAPQRTTLDRFLDSEKARGATPEQLSAARSVYIGVSEAEMVNQGVRPRPCAAEEREALKRRMAEIRAGNFEAR